MIYFIAARTNPTGPIKIGYTTDLEKRLSQLSSGIAGGASVLASIAGGPAIESYLHERFSECRVSGEWFEPNDDLRQFVQDVQNRVPGIIPMVEPGPLGRRSPAEIAADCIAEAKEMLAFLLGREFKGIGDTIQATMHRLEQKTGIPYSIAFRVRQRPMNDMLVSNYFIIKEAYDAALAKDAGAHAASSRLYSMGTFLAGPKDEAESQP